MTSTAREMLLCFNVYATNHAFARLYRPMLEPLGLTYPQFLVMLSLGGKDGQSVGHLSSDLGLETNTLSPLLKRLEAAGLILRIRGRDDERKVHVSLTEAGHDMAKRAALVPARMNTAVGLDSEEMKAAIAQLQGLRRVLSALDQSARSPLGKA